MLFNQYNTRKSLSKTIQETSYEGSTTDQCCGIFPFIYTTTHWRARHILQTNTATHEHTKFFKLSLSFLHQTAHQVHFLHCVVSCSPTDPLHFHWRKRMTTPPIITLLVPHSSSTPFSCLPSYSIFSTLFLIKHPSTRCFSLPSLPLFCKAFSHLP